MIVLLNPIFIEQENFIKTKAKIVLLKTIFMLLQTMIVFNKTMFNQNKVYVYMNVY